MLIIKNMLFKFTKKEQGPCSNSRKRINVEKVNQYLKSDI